jgi:hypothetical protein
MKFLLVGQVFAPGATAIITKGLSQYAGVMLVAEPENPYDANAVRVFVPRESITLNAELDEALAAFALTSAALTFPFAIGHLGAKYETKAAKAAMREGHQFRLATDWHGLSGNSRTSGRLIQHPNGTCLIEVNDTI